MQNFLIDVFADVSKLWKISGMYLGRLSFALRSDSFTLPTSTYLLSASIIKPAAFTESRGRSSFFFFLLSRNIPFQNCLSRCFVDATIKLAQFFNFWFHFYSKVCVIEKGKILLNEIWPAKAWKVRRWVKFAQQGVAIVQQTRRAICSSFGVKLTPHPNEMGHG